MRDNQDYHETRKKYIGQVEDISKMLKHQRNMKKIKKECMKNMVEGPCLIDQQSLKPLQMAKKNSILTQKSC